MTPAVTNPALARRLDALTADQRAAVTADQRDIVLSAGAGSGKTHTLVSRYLWLLAQGLRPREIVAVTFTDNAGLELRARIRAGALEAAAAATDDSTLWRSAQDDLDAARIGTFHSLAAEILRAHPAEAGLDPEFRVLDEVEARLVADEVVEATLAALASEGSGTALFQALALPELRRLAHWLLQHRADVGAALAGPGAWEPLFAAAVRSYLDGPAAEPFAALAALSADARLEADAGPRLAAVVRTALATLAACRADLAAGQAPEACFRLWALRRNGMPANVGSRSGTAQPALRAARDRYDQTLGAWLGGLSAGQPAPNPDWEAALAALSAPIATLHARLVQAYDAALAAQAALDFDDLEVRALRLLGDHAAARAAWRRRIKALLVDEVQDTNPRQVALVAQLAGADLPGRVFWVGDARQSIYGFRGADVTVWTDLVARATAAGDTVLALGTSFRTHAALLDGVQDLLESVFAADEPVFGSAAPRLSAQHTRPRALNLAPYVELQLGLGESAAAARTVAAGLLAEQLASEYRNGELTAWAQVALLFRAASGFSVYERALDAAGIPYVTLAGGGFYDRPEVRDVLGLLRGLASPWDETALVGLLRSPVVGLSDPGLARLLAGGRDRLPLVERLAEPATDRALSPADGAALARARRLLARLGPWVDRLSVAELLARLIAATDLAAVLAGSGEARLERNLDKLLADAQQSGATRVDDYLAYIGRLRRVQAREGEAPVEAAEAVRLMTVHRAKGLEFPLVVLADAGHQGGGGPPAAYLQPGVGLALADGPSPSLAARWARHQAALAAAAEERRLLYVAATRAEDRLLVNGHATMGAAGRVAPEGWLATLLSAAGVRAESLIPGPAFRTDGPGAPITVRVADTVPAVTPLESAASKAEGSGEAVRPLWPPPPRPADPIPYRGS